MKKQALKKLLSLCRKAQNRSSTVIKTLLIEFLPPCKGLYFEKKNFIWFLFDVFFLSTQTMLPPSVEQATTLNSHQQ